MKLEYKLLPHWPKPQFTSFHLFPLSGLGYKTTGDALTNRRSLGTSQFVGPGRTPLDSMRQGFHVGCSELLQCWKWYCIRYFVEWVHKVQIMINILLLPNSIKLFKQKGFQRLRRSIYVFMFCYMYLLYSMYLKHAWIYVLTPKGLRGVFSKKHSKRPFLAQEALCTFNRKILP
jgi:hypothetical protein